MGIFNSLRNNLGARLPMIMIGLVGMGCVMFGIVAILPDLKLHEDLASVVAAGDQAIAATLTLQSQSDESSILQRQIEGALAKLDTSSADFLTQAQVDALLHKLYDYAESSGAKIAILQAQQSESSQAGNNPVAVVYDTKIFRLQVNGSFIELMNFVLLAREASEFGVTISALNIAKSDTQYALTMNILMRVSPLASGKAFVDLAAKDTLVPIALVPTLTPSSTSTPSPTPTPTITLTPTITPTPRPTSTPTSTPTPLPTETPLPPTATLVGQCSDQTIQKMPELQFSKILQASGTCDIQVWDFVLDTQTTFVMDVVRRSGSGQYRIELHDSFDKVLEASLSSVDGRGILVADALPGRYALTIVPLAATGTWVYDIAIWPGLPALSFSWAQNSYSNHTSLGTQSNVMTWSYVLTGGTQAYRIESIRTDGDLEYDLVVLDESDKEVATATSDGGNVMVNLTTGGGTYIVQITTVEGTSGSYRIALVR